MTHSERTRKLREAIEEIARRHKTVACAVAVRDYDSDFRFTQNGDRVFHAASTIKVAILLAVLKAVEEGRAGWDDPLHVRNRFLSIVDRSAFSIDANSDGYPQLYRSVGRTAQISDLAKSMVTSSSNLATNLLLDFVRTEYATRVLEIAGVDGVQLRRGVEDEKAHAQWLDNEATANGLLKLFEVFRGDFLAKESRDRAIHILLEQKFKSMLPAGLPSHATVAHKTGEISTACHDAGIVYLPEREPYLVAVLTEVDRETNDRRDVVAEISKAVYEAVTGKAPGK
ncbi:MAG: serine hydrolase [Chthoniobacterales bacterium]